MSERTSLFDNMKQCEFCGRSIPKDSENDVCPSCVENQLFQKVKEYIRAYDVNEYMVADEFNIPLKQVKKWIREGRIEYKEKEIQKKIDGLHCQNCGVAITFGTYCSKCMKIQNGIQGFDLQPLTPGANNKMRFLDKD